MRLLGPLPGDVLEVVAEMTGIPADVIRSRRTYQRAEQARLIAYWVSREFGGTWKELGRWWGRDYTSVLSGAQRVEKDPTLKALAIEVSEVVYERYGGRRAEQAEAEVRR